MSLILKQNVFNIKNEDGTYMSLNVAADESTEEKLAQIEAKGQETIASIPDDYTTLSNEVTNLKEDLSESVKFTPQTLTESQKTQAKKNLSISDGLSDEAKEAFLACFRNAAWKGTDGLTFYNALKNALYGNNKITVFNRRTINHCNELNTDNWYLTLNPNGQDGQCGTELLSLKNEIFSVVNPDVYMICYWEASTNQLRDYILRKWSQSTYEDIQMSGYYAGTSKPSVSYVTSVLFSNNYGGLTFRHVIEANFTDDEINNAEGTIFVHGNKSDCVIWDGLYQSDNVPKWCDKNAIIGISDPSKLSFVAGYGFSSGFFSDDQRYGGFPVKVSTTVGRAISLAQLLVGDFDRKTIKLTTNQLSTGRHVAFALWYGYLDSDKTFNGTNWVAQGNENEYIYGKWMTEVTLPVVPSKTGTRIIALAFKNTDADIDFTQAELRELPNLITIS